MFYARENKYSILALVFVSEEDAKPYCTVELSSAERAFLLKYLGKRVARD